MLVDVDGSGLFVEDGAHRFPSGDFNLKRDGHALAAAACQANGATAANDAAQAAALNPVYNTLAVDEKALQTQEAQGGGVLGSGAAAALTLAPGDVVATGTPPGVSTVRPGDELRGEIEGLGAIANRVVGAG